MICNNECDVQGHSVPCFPSPYKLRVGDKATSLNKWYSIIVDVTSKPKHICRLLYLLFLRMIVRRHDYSIMQYHVRRYMTMFPYVTRPRKCSSLRPLEHHIGGGVSELFSLAQLQPYILKDFMMIKPFAELMYKLV